ncbi:hypothetical protein [Acinetobacter variabilis]|uniref:hypothetical protein n=1 Tax=Acinetobacter variabilis TaxID=70346 RepID=UPI0028A896F9|nr:hypothetical protein [Acinetobacter variabilis]
MNFEELKPYTQEELNQQSVWAEQFEEWWENEGQYQRAGGGDYEKTFAWWAWLNREQSKEAAFKEMDEVIKMQDADLRKYGKQIENLKEQLNNMEQCYIEKKKQVEAVSQVLCELKESMIDFQEMDLYDKGHRVTTEYVIADLEEALRGANDFNLPR